MCFNKMCTRGKACVIQVSVGQMWFEFNVYPWEGLWFV